MSRSKTAQAARDARDALLDRVLLHVEKHGLRDSSLRAIAAQLGTSHRMLIYHFGSAEEFWDAVIARMRKRDRNALSDAAAVGQVPFIEETWQDLAAPRNLPVMRLFFELYGQALHDRKRFSGFLSEVVDGWLDTVGEALGQQFEVTSTQARVQARLRLAVLRGLLLDLLTTGDRAGTTEALELFAKRLRMPERRKQKSKRRRSVA